jgi:hypothetical protein
LSCLPEKVAPHGAAGDLVGSSTPSVVRSALSGHRARNARASWGFLCSLEHGSVHPGAIHQVSRSKVGEHGTKTACDVDQLCAGSERSLDADTLSRATRHFTVVDRQQKLAMGLLQPGQAIQVLSDALDDRVERLGIECSCRGDKAT